MFRGEASLRSALIEGKFPNGSALTHDCTPVKMNMAHPHLTIAMKQSQQQQDSKVVSNFCRERVLAICPAEYGRLQRPGEIEFMDHPS